MGTAAYCVTLIIALAAFVVIRINRPMPTGNDVTDDGRRSENDRLAGDTRDLKTSFHSAGGSRE
jgi:hypothetical protein